MITITEALELSVVKWKFLIVHPEIGDYGDPESLPEELKTLNAHCGLCEFYKGQDMGGCRDCPLKDEGHVCCEEFTNGQDGMENDRSRRSVLLSRHIMLNRLIELLECAKHMPKGWMESD